MSRVFLDERFFGIGAADAEIWFSPGDTVQVDFQSDTPVSSDQFFSMVSSVEKTLSDLYGVATVLSIYPIDQTHFRAILKWNVNGSVKPGTITRIDGINFTTTGAQLVSGSNQSVQPIPSPTSPTQSPNRFSTSQIVGMSLAGAGLLGGILYIATRSP